jgi:hypothetical protein
MTLRTFMFAADALRLEDGVGFQMPPSAEVPRPPSPDEVKRQNANAMAQFMGGMANVKVKR